MLRKVSWLKAAKFEKHIYHRKEWLEPARKKEATDLPTLPANFLPNMVFQLEMENRFAPISKMLGFMTLKLQKVGA